MFSGGKFTEVSVWRADYPCDFFKDSNYNNTTEETLGELKL